MARATVDEVVAHHTLEDVRAWPAAFDFAVDWPDGKAGSTRLCARGYVGGQATFITGWQRHGESSHGQPVRLVLVPIRE